MQQTYIRKEKQYRTNYNHDYKDKDSFLGFQTSLRINNHLKQVFIFKIHNQ